MNCDLAYERMLEADPAELRREAPGELSAHLATCGRCRLAAERLLDEQEMLRHVLDHVEPREPVEQALAQAAWEARRRGRRRAWLGLGPALAAAGLAGVMVVGSIDRDAAPPTAPPPPKPVPVVQPPPGANVALFHTDNPDIVVVWLY